MRTRWLIAIVGLELLIALGLARLARADNGQCIGTPIHGGTGPCNGGYGCPSAYPFCVDLGSNNGGVEGAGVQCPPGAQLLQGLCYFECPNSCPYAECCPQSSQVPPIAGEECCNMNIVPSPIPTPTFIPATPTATASRTPTATPTQVTPTPTVTYTQPTATPTVFATVTGTPTASPTATQTTPTATPTYFVPTATPTSTPICGTDIKVTTTSTQIFIANDVNGLQNRHYQHIQNKGPNSDIWCQAGTNNHCVANAGYHIRLNDQWLLDSSPAAWIPALDVCCIAGQAASLVSVCDY